jgi:hypothetical protein
MARSNQQFLPDPYPANEGPLKAPFSESLHYITGCQNGGLNRFRQFLLEGKHWSVEQVDIFLEAFADRWPPIKYPQVLFEGGLVMANLWPRIEAVLTHPARESLIRACGFNFPKRWLDYGGFLHAELPTIRAAYQTWWKRQLDRTKNLPQKKIKHPAKKIA